MVSRACVPFTRSTFSLYTLRFDEIEKGFARGEDVCCFRMGARSRGQAGGWVVDFGKSPVQGFSRHSHEHEVDDAKDFAARSSR